MKIRIFSFCLFLLLCVNLGHSALDILVESSPSWGEISTVDVETLCENITGHFEKHLRPENEIHDRVKVYRTFVGYNFATLDPDPAVKYQIKIHLLRDMRIRADDFYYFILPFAHEFCHILHNFEVTAVDNPNLWFQEGLSTMGGVWVLKSMAETWKDDSPFGTSVAQDGGVAFFGLNFDHYADAHLNVFPDFRYDGTGKEWLELYEMSLRRESHGRFTRNPAQLALKFLPIFEKNPEAWNAVRKLPASKGKMSEYMQDWYNAVDVQDKQYVEAIAMEMGIRVTSPVVDMEIDADVDNNGYIDLYDVMIVRSGMRNSVSYDTDVNDDGITNEEDLLIVKAKAIESIVAAAPRRIVVPYRGKRKVNLRTWGALKIRE